MGDHVSCVILSAGNSGRMGCHKALLQFDESRTFIQQLTGVYHLAGAGQIIVVCSPALALLLSKSADFFGFPVELVINSNPEAGRFNSLRLGLERINNGNCCFFQNVDNPFVSVELLTLMHESFRGDRAVIPVYSGRPGHPVLLGREIIRKILEAPEPNARIDDFLKASGPEYFEVLYAGVQVNINTPEEYRKLFGRDTQKENSCIHPPG